MRSSTYSSKYFSKIIDVSELSDKILDLEKLERELQAYERRRKRALARRRDAQLGVFIGFPTGGGP